jgi:hypothetical protein
MIKLVLYGTLKDPELFFSLTGFNFLNEVSGYICGKIYEVTDYTEPQKIFRYPLFVPDDNGTKIIAKEVAINVSNHNEGNFWKILQDFEGDLYKLEIINFYPFNKKPHKSRTYVGNPEKAREIRFIENTSFYLWQK